MEDTGQCIRGLQVSGRFGGREPTRVAIVTKGSTVAGAEKQLLGLALLKGCGDEVGRISLLPSLAFEDVLVAAGIPVMTLRLHSRARGLTAIRSGSRALRQFRPEVLVCFLYQAILLGRVAGRRNHVPLVISSIRSHRFQGRGRGLLVRLTDGLGSVTTTNSTGGARSLLRQRMVPSGRLLVIPNGVDPSLSQRSPRERERLRRTRGVGRRRVPMAGGRKSYQGNGLAHDACRLGRGASVATVHRRPGTTGAQTLGARVLPPPTGTGHVPGTAQRCHAAHVGRGRFRHLVSSVRQGSPYAGLEALAVELPVVATRVGGNAELVEDGVSGYLVPPGDAGSLGAAMRRLTLTSEQDRRAMGGRGRAHIVREHDLDQVHHRWRELIDGSAGRSARGRWTLGGAGGRRRWRSPAGLPAADGARGGTPP